MKILVTGGTGFIGHHLLAALAKTEDSDIFLLVRNLRRLDASLLSCIFPLAGDLGSIPPLPSDLDVVFHLAGLTKGVKAADYYTVNYKGTASLLDSLSHQKKRIKFILLSSLAAVGPAAADAPAGEVDEPRPLNPYGESKLLAEQIALEHKENLTVAIVRVGGVYGPGDRDFLPFFRFINRGLLPLFDSGRMRLSLCYVEDLVRFLLLVAATESESGEIWHVADPRIYTWEEIGTTAASILGKRRLTKVKIPAFVVFTIAAASQGLSRISKRASVINLDKYREMKAAFWVADTSKARRKLGFQPEFSLERGLRETLAWYQEKGWL